MRPLCFVGLLCVGLPALSSASPVLDDTSASSIYFRGPFEVSHDSVHNIHVEYDEGNVFAGELRVVFGDCQMTEVHRAHQEIGLTYITEERRPERFLWIVPESTTHGCLHAFTGTTLVGRSVPITVQPSLRKRQSIADVADPLGPWFDGIAYLQNKTETAAFVSEAKSKCESDPKPGPVRDPLVLMRLSQRLELSALGIRGL